MYIDQLGKYQVKDMNAYIEPLIDEILMLWDGVTMYDISRPIGKRQFVTCPNFAKIILSYG